MKRFIPLDGEKVIIEKPIHWKNYIFSSVLLLMAIEFLAFIATHENVCFINIILGQETITAEPLSVFRAIDVIILGAVILACFGRIIKVVFIRYYVTSERIIMTTGFFTIRTKEMLIARCETVSIKQTVYERIFNCADILCQAPGSEIVLDDIGQPEKFKAAILEQMAKVKKQ